MPSSLVDHKRVETIAALLTVSDEIKARVFLILGGKEHCLVCLLGELVVGYLPVVLPPELVEQPLGLGQLPTTLVWNASSTTEPRPVLSRYTEFRNDQHDAAE